jgi:hypothetical protein
MAVVKRSISFDPEVLAEAEAAARTNGYQGNLSALVNDAVAHDMRLRGLAGALAEWEAEFGPITDEERAQADRELDDPR